MRKSVWLFIILAAIAIVYGGMWFATAVFVRQQTELWLEGRRHQGLIVTYGAPTLAGFPLKAEVRFPDFAVAAPELEGSPGWTWRTPALRIFARPFVFNRFVLDLGGSHRLSGIETRDLLLTAESADAAFVLNGQGVESAGIQMAGATARFDQDAAPFSALANARADFTVTAAAIHMNLAADQATFPDVLPQPLTRTLQNLKLSLDITGPIATGAPLPDVLEAWRAGGGTLEVRDLVVDWPPVTATGSGTIALDRALQPEGAFTATFHGFLEVIDMLVAGGRMQPREASIARGALALLATTPAEGAPPELKLSITVQDRKAYAGPVTLMEMPTTTWRKNVVVP